MASDHPYRTDITGLAYDSNLFFKNLLLSQHISLFAHRTRGGNDKLRLLTDTLRLRSKKIANHTHKPSPSRSVKTSTRSKPTPKHLKKTSPSSRRSFGMHSERCRCAGRTYAMQPDDPILPKLETVQNHSGRFCPNPAADAAKIPAPGLGCVCADRVANQNLPEQHPYSFIPIIKK